MITFKRVACLLLLTIGLNGCVSTSDSSEHAAASKKMGAADANIQLGMNLLAEGQVQSAQQKLLSALQVAPDYPPAWYTMAYYLEVTGQSTLANEYYLKAIDLSPKSGDSLNNYGTFLCHSGKMKAALPYFVAATHDTKYIDSSGAFENAGLCALLIPDAKAAQQYFTKAVLRDPNRSRSLQQLAAIAYQQKNYPSAKYYLQRYFLTAKPTPETLLLAVNISRQIDGSQAASVYARQLQRQFPQSVEAREGNYSRDI